MKMAIVSFITKVLKSSENPFKKIGRTGNVKNRRHHPDDDIKN